jgi:hypothetical protein
MKFKFRYIGPPFSLTNPGAICEFDPWDVPDMRRASHDWLEVSDTKHIQVEPKFIKMRGKPKQLVTTVDDSKG